MRARNIQIGEVYAVEVPHRLPEGWYRLNGTGPLGWSRLWLRGARFRIVASAVRTFERPAIVEGWRITHRSLVQVELTAEQAAELGLPTEEYQVVGMLSDTHGQPVDLPDLEHVSVPVRWLRTLDAPASRTHRDIDAPPWV